VAEPAVAWSRRYVLDWPGHVFPTAKYALLFEALRAEGLADADWIEPGPVARDALLLGHERGHVEEIERLTADPACVALRFEIPLSRRVVDAVLHHCEGTRLAVEAALARGAAISLGGGFHHAFPDRGEGFCFYNDVVVALRAAHAAGRLRRAVVVDVDVHQGNGTAAAFRARGGDAGKRPFATYSIHQEDLYPVPKEESDVDVGLMGGAGDRDYLDALAATLPRFLDDHPAELLLYVAGADPYERDRLGELRLTRDGLRQRDDFVLAEAARRGLKVAAVVAGGYPPDVDDVVAIHADLWRALRRFAQGGQARAATARTGPRLRP